MPPLVTREYFRASCAVIETFVYFYFLLLWEMPDEHDNKDSGERISDNLTTTHLLSPLQSSTETGPVHINVFGRFELPQLSSKNVKLWFIQVEMRLQLHQIKIEEFGIQQRM